MRLCSCDAVSRMRHFSPIPFFNARFIDPFPERGLRSLTIQMNYFRLPPEALIFLLALSPAALRYGNATAAAPSPSMSDQDVGPVGVAGNCSQTAGQVQIQGAGADIWHGADGFHFAYAPWDGDCQAVVRVVSVEPTDPWAKVGVMVRADLTAGSPHAMVALAAQNGVTFIRRAKPGGWSYDDAWQSMRRIGVGGRAVFQQRGSTFRSATADSVVGFSAPVWLKLVRQGSVFIAYTSQDGATWTWLGTDIVPMASQVYVGLAVSSHSVAKLCAAAMDNLSIGAPTGPAPGSAGTGAGDGLTKRACAWRCPELPEGVVIEADPRLGLDGSLAARPGGATYQLLVDEPEDRLILARLGEHGPVVDSATVHGLSIAGVSESGAYYMGRFPDGSRLVETAVAQSRILDDARIEMQIIVGGVMFDDGGLVKVLRPGDFDETRLAKVRFIMPPGALTSNCHVMRAYQGQAYLGEY